MNKRNTIQKMFIIEALKKLNHPTALEIYIYVYNKYPHVSKATIHRNLNLLVEQKEVYKLVGLENASRYDINIKEHYHFVCHNCKRISDLKMDYQKNLNNKIKNMNDYRFDSHTIIFNGLCPDCQKNKEDKNGL